MPSSNAIHGKHAIVYLSQSAATAAQPLAEQTDWSLDFNQPIVQVTPLNSTFGGFVKGVIDWTMTFSGNFDPVSKLLWLASIATTKCNMYLYPQGALNPGGYYYGVGWVTLGKVAGGNMTSKAASSCKITGDGDLTSFP